MMEEKRTIGDWEVLQGIHIGDREVLLLLDPTSAEAPYVVCYNQLIPGLGVDHPTECVGSNDYLEMMEEFLSRVKGQIVAVLNDREKSSEPQEVFGAGHCLPGGMDESLVGRVVVMKADVLRHEYRNAARQIILVTGGFGASPNARGRAVFGNNVFSGTKSDWRREDVLGILDPAKAPEWVKPGLEAIRAQKAKDRGDR